MDRGLMQKLSRMTTKNGCTEAEAKTAHEKLAKMIGIVAAEKKVAEAEMERRRRFISEQEKARSRAESIRALREFQAKLMKDWDDLGYDLGNEDYREFKKKNWWWR